MLVLHMGICEGLAPPRNTAKQRMHKVNPNGCQSVHLIDQTRGTIEKAAHEPSRMTPTSIAIPSQHHTDPCSRVNVLSANATQGALLAGRAALLHRHHPHQLGTPSSRGTRHQEGLVGSRRRTASLRGGGRRCWRGGGGARELWGCVNGWRGEGAGAGIEGGV